MSIQVNVSKSTSWVELYQAALVETDRAKLSDLVGAVETAIARRRQELTNIEENDKERDAMVLAAQQLLKIKTECWPSIKPNSDTNQRWNVIDTIRRVESIHHWRR